MGDHAEDGGVDTEVGEGRDAEHHEAHVGHRRERDQAFHVALGQAAERAVDDADHREHADVGRPGMGGLRQDRDGNAHKAVRAELQEDGGEENRADGGRLGVGVGQPGVEREHGHLDGEPHEQAGEYEQLGAVGDRLRRVLQRHHVEGLPALEVEGEEAQDHQRRAEQREEEELDGRVLAVRPAPHADHEVHRQQDQLEEDEEEDQVLGEEGAVHPRLEHEHEDQERLGVVRLGPVVPRVHDAHDGDHHRQQEQRQRDAVDAHVVAAVDDVDPAVVHDELELAAVPVVELRQQIDAHAGGGDREHEGHGLLGRLLRTRHEQEQTGGDGRKEHGGAERPVVEGVHVSLLSRGQVASTSAAAKITTAPNRIAAYCCTRPVWMMRRRPPPPSAVAPVAFTSPSTILWSITS